MRGFILRLQHFSSTLRTNSKQALRKHRKTDSSSFQHDILDQGAVPLRKTGSQVPEAKKSFPEPSWGLPSTSGPKSFSLSLSLFLFFRPSWGSAGGEEEKETEDCIYLLRSWYLLSARPAIRLHIFQSCKKNNQVSFLAIFVLKLLFWN